MVLTMERHTLRKVYMRLIRGPQLLTALPYLFETVTIVASKRLSDKRMERYWALIAIRGCAIVGMLLAATLQDSLWMLCGTIAGQPLAGVQPLVPTKT